MLRWIWNRFTSMIGSYAYNGLEQFLANGEYERVLRNCNYLCERRPDELAAFYYKARALMGLQKFQEALRVTESILDTETEKSSSDSWREGIHECHSTCLLSLELYPQLLAFTRTSLVKLPENLPVQIHMLAASLKLGKTAVPLEVIESLKSRKSLLTPEQSETLECYVAKQMVSRGRKRKK